MILHDSVVIERNVNTSIFDIFMHKFCVFLSVCSFFKVRFRNFTVIELFESWHSIDYFPQNRMKY